MDLKWIINIKKYCNSLNNSKIFIHNMNPEFFPTSKKKAAVLVPICYKHGQASILFNLRSNEVSTHKGQVSFPGGHLNEGESGKDAAVRETYEECGDNIGDIEIIGECQSIPSITGTLVTPIIGIIEKDVKDFEHLNPNKKEVERVFCRSLEELTNPNYREYYNVKRAGNEIVIPCFGPDNDERIWGLTAIILNAVLDKVIIPNKPKLENPHF